MQQGVPAIPDAFTSHKTVILAFIAIRTSTLLLTDSEYDSRIVKAL